MVRKRVCKGKYFILKSFSGHIEFCIRLQPTDCFASFLHSTEYMNHQSKPSTAPNHDGALLPRATHWLTTRCKTAHFRPRNGPFCSLKWAISHCDSAHFATRLCRHWRTAWISVRGGVAFYGVVVCRLYCAAMCIYGVRQSLFSVFYANFASD